MKIFDVHTHFGPWNSFPIKTTSAEALVGLLRRSNIQKAVVTSVQAVLTDFIAGNDETQAGIEQQEMLYGYIYVDPHRIGDSIGEVNKRRTHPKFVGLKSRDDYHGMPYNGSAYREIFIAVREYRLPVLLHTFSFYSMQCAIELAADYGAPVILTHMGGSEWARCEQMLGKELPANVYFDPVSSFSAPGKYELALSLVGENNLVFGTDCNLFNPHQAIGAIESSEISEEVKQKIYWENAARIFNIT